MSKIASFVQADLNDTLATVRKELRRCRTRLERMTTDPQKDGADSEALIAAFSVIDRLIGALP